LSHVMKYFRPEEDSNAKLPKSFMSGFLEVGSDCPLNVALYLHDIQGRN